MLCNSGAKLVCFPAPLPAPGEAPDDTDMSSTRLTTPIISFFLRAKENVAQQQTLQMRVFFKVKRVVSPSSAALVYRAVWRHATHVHMTRSHADRRSGCACTARDGRSENTFKSPRKPSPYLRRLHFRLHIHEACLCETSATACHKRLKQAQSTERRKKARKVTHVDLRFHHQLQVSLH
ncbi:hypothetical protein NDU88_001950 [Pleurodeles waltl]|uniref:Uncharacterized protein n=1 Tax=Pleurodeles waltl TaxID=8319 RepID=A0AAV7REA4_PLEWA|nr:hypothetical protein NDU88_001950 [Pleurodeles waltl]